MSVFNGQPVDADTTNAAFMSRTNDTDTVGKLGLDNAGSASIDDAQKYINKIADADGTLSETDTTNKTYSSTNYIANGDSRKVAIGKLDTQVKTNSNDIDAIEIVNTSQQVEINDHENRLDNLETNTMTIGGNKTFSANVTVQGDFEVQGTTTYINTTNLNVKDANVMLNQSGTDITANGAGLTVDRPSGNGSLIYDSALASKWKAGQLSSESEIITASTTQTMTGVKSFSSGLNSDSINEFTLNNGVSIDGVLIKDGLVDGRDVSVDGSSLTSHIANTSNPHATTAAQVGADPSGTAASAVSAHELASDPHPQYLTSTEGDNAYLKRGAGDYNSFTSKGTPVNADVVLIEDSADSFNKKKITLTDLLGGTASPLTTKGDLYTYSTVNARLPVGTNGQVLSADSSQTTGLKWTTPTNGGVNFITNSIAEIDTTGWATYADAAGAAPVDGTGGSPSVTWTQSTSSPLAGSGSFLFTKDAANRQGQGVSFDFTLDPAYRARVMNIKFDYIVGSGTFAAGTSSTDSDLTVWLYDVTNSTLIQPSAFRLLSNSSTIADTFQSTFQTSATGASYRLIVHCSTTSASAYTVKFDNVQVTPTEYAFGTPVTDWVSYTPTLTTNLGANPVTLNTGAGYFAPNGRWRRVGDSIEVYAHFRNGTGGVATGTAGNLAISIPSGVSIDTNKIASDGSIGSSNGWAMSNLGGNYSDVQNIYLSSNLMQVQQGGTGSYYTLSSITAGFAVHYHGFFPVTGWSSSVQTSDQTSTRVVSFKAQNATATLSTSASKVTYSTVVFDDLNAYSSGTYTVKVAGKYKVHASLLVARTATVASNVVQIWVRYNGSNGQAVLLRDQSTEAQSRTIAITDILDCKAGDTIEIQAAAEGTSPTVPSDGNRNFILIERISGPNQIAASETVVARYTKADATAFNGGGVRIFGTKLQDTHGAYNTSTGYFTAPISGFYHIEASVQAANVAYVAGGNARLYFSANGITIWGAEHISEAPYTGFKMLNASTTVYLLAGQTLGVITDSSPTVNFAADATRNSISIFRVGM
jgi:hypothetical protein